MITYAKENDVHHILISGDLYDKKNISSTARNVFLTAVTDNQDIIFYYLKGNHDAESMFIGMNKIPDNLKLFMPFMLPWVQNGQNIRLLLKKITTT